MTDIERTPAATLTRARDIALAAGIRYVYTGNVHDRAGGTTFCPGCGKAVIERDWHEILSYDLTDDGRCRHCAAQIPGRFEAFDGQWGRRRVPVRVSVEPAARQPRAGSRRPAGGRRNSRRNVARDSRSTSIRAAWCVPAFPRLRGRVRHRVGTGRAARSRRLSQQLSARRPRELLGVAIGTFARRTAEAAAGWLEPARGQDRSRGAALRRRPIRR